jgi:Glycosyltransferase family 25 (LPS biosynthesis protein)
MSPTGFAGYYINLDRCLDRRENIESQLRHLELGDHYRRFSAIDGARLAPDSSALSAGERGAYASHLAVLRQASGSDRHVHIIEDDVLLSPEMFPMLRRFDSQGVFDQLDILYLDVAVPFESGTLADYERLMRLNVRTNDSGSESTLANMSLVELRSGVVFSSLSSYVVAKRSIARLATSLEDAAGKERTQPVDLVVRNLVLSGAMRAACCMPFLTSLNLALDLDSTTRTVSADERRSRLAGGIIRHAFFVRPDWPSLHNLLASHFPQAAQSLRSQVVMRILDYRIFGDYRSF